VSVFDKIEDLRELDDQIIEKYYGVSYDWVAGNRIKKGLYMKRDVIKIQNEISPLYAYTYYYPEWIFQICMRRSLAVVIENAKIASGKPRVTIEVSKFEVSNMRARFNKMIDGCGVFKYKGDTYINFDMWDRSTDGLLVRIENMLYDYITKETYNSRFFRKR